MIQAFLEKIKFFSKLASRKDKLTLLIIVSMMIASSGLEMISIGAIFPLVSLIVDPTASANHHIFGPYVNLGKELFGNHLLAAIALGVFLTFLAKNLCLYSLAVVQNNFIFKKMAGAQVRLYQRYLQAPYVYHLNFDSADLIRNITTEVATSFNNFFRTTLSVLIDVALISAIITLLFIVSPLMTLGISCGFIVVSYGFYWMLRKKLYNYGIIRQLSCAKMIKWVNQGLGGIREVKVLGREDFFIDHFRDGATHTATSDSQFSILSQTPRLFFEMLAITLILTLIVATHLLNPSGQNVLPLIAMYSLAGMRLAPAFNRLIGSSSALRYYKPSLDVVLSEFARLNRGVSSEVKTTTPKQPTMPSGLHLDDVGFQYPGTRENALKQINLGVKSHEVIGIVGESGAGKTTLINIILGLLKPSSGSVLIDGKPIGFPNTNGNGHLIGYVPQEIYLSDDTIKNNIAYGLPKDQIDEKRVWEALRLAQLDSFISSSPEQLETMVGERGVRISGGQKQRIGIARALYTNPKLLVFDEPTSALDAETEKELAASIKVIAHNKMVIIVTHREGLLTLCGRIYRMSQGKLTEMGQEIPLSA